MFEVNARFSNSSPKFSSFKARIVHSTYLLERERERESHEKVTRFLLMRFETKQEKIELLEKEKIMMKGQIGWKYGCLTTLLALKSQESKAPLTSWDVQ